jgi:hypothetical protein
MMNIRCRDRNVWDTQNKSLRYEIPGRGGESILISKMPATGDARQTADVREVPA